MLQSTMKSAPPDPEAWNDCETVSVTANVPLGLLVKGVCERPTAVVPSGRVAVW
jgi:hypothetical protein